VTSREFQDRLARRAKRAGVPLTPELATRLETYFRLLETWNRKINLTGLNLTEAAPETLDRLLIEPLVAVRHIPGSGIRDPGSVGAIRMLDVGSGGGSPAIPMALAASSVRLLMVESKTRKAVFLREAIRAADLERADVAASRFEELLARPDLHEAHDLVTIRAVRIEPRLLSSLQAFLKPRGLLFLFRGTTAADPSETVPPPLVWSATYPLLESLRSRLVILEKRPVGQPRSVPRET
jgi:16S rRNA (guanine527-N7)-methyltransferase